MEVDYDVIVLGTGLKECILSGLMSVSKLKVLHIDRNSYYGGESASLNLETLYKKFRPNETKIPEDLGRTRDYNVDLCPKFLMACGDLVKVLLHTKVTKYLEFKSISGSYVLKDGKPHKVPSTPAEALSSELMGIFQKRKFKSFISFVNDFNYDDKKTWGGLDIDKLKVKDVFAHFGLDENTQTFTGHALALHLDDSYLDQNCRATLEKVKLYAYSVSRYGNSPYIYPMWGLGGLPEGFSRLAAINGGTFMLNKPIEEILYDKEGAVIGIRSEGKEARCKKLIGDPSYFMGTDKIKKVGQIARCICILSHPIPFTNDVDSCQILIPGKTCNRKSDIYISLVSYSHQVASKGKFIALATCPVETKDPRAELAPALKVVGKIDQEFFWVADNYVPVNNPAKDNVFITQTYDATTHFEDATREVMSLYTAFTGKPLDLTIQDNSEGEDGEQTEQKDEKKK
jgi:Rab GDP dissociation inhibitor